MLGVIRKRDVLAHPVVTIQCFGWRVFLRTLTAGQSQTFLSLLMDSDVLDARRSRVPEIVERCVDLELKAASLYDKMAQRFRDCRDAREFFETLSRQEEEHAELLRLCREAAGRGRWSSHVFEPCAEAVPRLEARMKAATDAAEGISSVVDALRLVIEIESSEVNRVFQGVVDASDSSFVRSLDAFRGAVRRHLDYIARSVPRIAPELKAFCRVVEDSQRV